MKGGNLSLVDDLNRIQLVSHHTVNTVIVKPFFSDHCEATLAGVSVRFDGEYGCRDL
jgi:hypothetical protein